MFSRRTNWNFLSNELTLLRERKILEGKPILDVTESNPTKCNFDFLFSEIISSLNSEENILYSPNPKGNLQARETICKYYAERDISISPEQIILTSSSSEAYSLLFRLLCNVNEEILVPKPSYPLFDYLAQINDVAVKHYRLEYDGNWQIDFESLQKNISEKTKSIIIVNPNNPTGNFIHDGEREKLYQIANENNISVIEDEVFSDFRFQILDFRLKNSYPISHISHLHFTLNGISKLLALPQMKLGWIVIQGESKLQQEAISRLEILADTFLSVNTPIQNALPKLFLLRKQIQTEILQRIQSNYNLLKQQMSNSQCSILNVEGGWNTIIKIPNTKSDEQWAKEILEDENVFVHPGHFYDFESEGFLVVSLIQQKDIFEEGVVRIKKFVEKNG